MFREAIFSNFYAEGIFHWLVSPFSILKDFEHMQTGRGLFCNCKRRDPLGIGNTCRVRVQKTSARTVGFEHLLSGFRARSETTRPHLQLDAVYKGANCDCEKNVKNEFGSGCLLACFTWGGEGREGTVRDGNGSLQEPTIRTTKPEQS